MDGLEQDDPAAGGVGAARPHRPAEGKTELISSCDGFLQDFGVLESDMDQRPSSARGLALVLFPAAQGVDADSQQFGKGFLGEAEGVTRLCDLWHGLPCGGCFAALGFRIERDAGKAAIGSFENSKGPRWCSLATLQCIFSLL